MKAAVYDSYGPPEVVRISEINVPVPKPDEILLKVHATTVNRTDCGFRSAEYFISRFFSGLLAPRIPVLGSEFAGEVIEIGDAVKEYRVGDRLFGFNDATFGAHAEFKIVKESDPVALIPEELTYTEAAPLTEGAHYALCDIRAANVKPGQDVLVNGGTGAIGSAAVQLLKYFGANVTAVCHTRHVSLVRSLGADVVIDYMNEDFTTVSQRFDFIFDAVGKSSFSRCKFLLKPKGIYVSTELGKDGENVWRAILHKFTSGKRVIFPIPKTLKSDIIFLGNLALQGHFKPVIDRTYPIDHIVEAYKYVETGQKIGNVIILPKHRY